MMLRLDAYLFENNFTQSRNKAKELILQGFVLVNQTIIKKPSYLIGDEVVEVIGATQYVSRAGDKLSHFLKASPILASLVEGTRCLDVGASTGGFVQVLLEYGASKVVAVDVGSEQLHASLRDESRIKSVEHCDIRDFEAEPFVLVTCDVSFVGSHLILPAIDRLSERDIVILLKPQFEVGREVKRDKKGVVQDPVAVAMAQERFEEHCSALAWKLQKKEISSVKGKEGNVEIFYHFTKG
jgi:23S rRNA (cytidine1920-2'-O)/16S rRNA (cytidine1409-2'-O)-methyltransferase